MNGRNAAAAAVAGTVAVVDAGSFILPYDFQLVQALAGSGRKVDFYASTTRYNQEFIDAMRGLPNVAVHEHAISQTVTSRARGALAYLRLLAQLLWNARRYSVVNLQFSGFWPAELFVLFWLRRKFVYTVHNAVPHDSGVMQHRPTRWLASLARSLVFVSESTRDDFLRRYGEGFAPKCSVLPHGLLPIAPALGATPYHDARPPRALAFWSTVKPYKGVELFAELAKSPEIARRGLSLAVYGIWASELQGLRQDLVHAGVQIQDRYLDEAELQALLAQDTVFLLPYQHASQSGALYSLLNHGRIVLCTDTGDLGAFMRRHGLEGLLLKDRSAQAVLDCLDHLQANRAAVLQSFQRAQDSLRWDRLLKNCGQAYRP